VVHSPDRDGRDYHQTSNVSFTAHLSKTTQQVWLSVQYHGDAWIFAERIKIAADDYRTSPKLQFDRAHDVTVWETARLPYTKKSRTLVSRIIQSRNVIIRFEGGTQYDLEVTPQMKHDLKLMVDAWMRSSCRDWSAGEVHLRRDSESSNG
jgi:hypothetical protein